jgi:hypothetical protein
MAPTRMRDLPEALVLSAAIQTLLVSVIYVLCNAILLHAFSNKGFLRKKVLSF